jgi:hypothetical protein
MERRGEPQVRRPCRYRAHGIDSSRSCDMVSQSRTVTASSSRVSKSTVTLKGVPHLVLPS